MWDLPGPGHESVSPALAGRFLTTAPPGKPQINLFIFYILMVQMKCLTIFGFVFSTYQNKIFPSLSGSETVYKIF